MALGEDNIQLVRNVIDALNTGDLSRVSDFISPNYLNHESQMDPVRSKMRGATGIYRHCGKYTECLF